MSDLGLDTAKNAPTRPAGSGVYVYVGEGLGVPGLAHEMTQEQADLEQVGELLAACIAAGIYVEKTVGKAVKEK